MLIIIIFLYMKRGYFGMKTILQFNSIYSFSTNRLYAEKIQSNDFDRLMQMYANQQVMATLGGIRSEDKTRDYLQQSLVHWNEHQFGLWMFSAKNTNEWVGRGGLRRLMIDGHEEVEITYALMPAFWRQGLATEFTLACSEIAFEILGLDNIVCFTLATNTASQRVMEKAGFVYEKSFVYFDQPHVFYRMKNNSN